MPAKSDYFSLVSGLQPLLFEARSAAASQLNGFFPFFGLGFDEEKGHDLFFFFEDIHRFHKTTTLRASKIANRVCFMKHNHMCLVVT